MLKLKLQYFGHLMEDPTHLKDLDAGKDWGQEEKAATKDEMVGYHVWHKAHESEQTPGDTAGQEAWYVAVPGVTESDMT